MIMVVIGLFFVNLSAQVNERTQIKELPKFEVCESDDRDRNACFKSEFVKLLEKNYLKEELAFDEVYQRQFEAFVEVDRKGNLSIVDFSTAESRIFVPFVRAIHQFPRLKPALNPLERPVDLRFKINVELERNQINVKNKVDLNIDLDFTFDDESSQKYQVN